MAINYEEFIYSNNDKIAKSLATGIKANKAFNKFLLRFKVNNKTYRKIFDYSKNNWNKKDSINKVNIDAEKFKEEKREALYNPFSLNTKIDFIANEYFTKHCSDTEWTAAKKRQYELYIFPFIGNKIANRVIEHDIDKIRTHMEAVNHHQYIEGGCSPRTIAKVLMQVLKPILEYGKRNGAIKGEVPKIKLPDKAKIKRKKTVDNASNKVVTLYNAIQIRYKYDPFYRALFMFALYGRRWNEIATLKWEDIDLKKNKYTIQNENSKISKEQTYDLPQQIKTPLLEMQDNNGLVFKSPKTGGKLHPPRKQLAKIKEDTGIEELTMHYFRHILVTALGETGTATTVLSASLGHTRTATVDEVYRTINHLKCSQSANKQLKSIIDTEVME